MLLKQNFYVLKLKKIFFPFIFISFTLCLLIFSKSNLSAVKSGLSLWANSVVPSLFPFFVATELLMHTDIVMQLGFLLNKYMKPLFNIRGEGSFCFIMGIISGYPIGAKIASNFRMNNVCSKEECERLLSFTNNSGPLFIIGTVGILMFKNTTIGFLLFITHILACISVGIVFRFWKKNSNSKLSFSKQYEKNSLKNNICFSNLGEVLAESITNSVSTIILIGGFVVIFSSIISIFNASGLLNVINNIFSPITNFFNINTSFSSSFFTGLLEITNGINAISNIPCKKLSINIVLSAFLLGFGGISVFLQVLSIISKTDLSIKPYIYGKLLQGILSALYTYLFLNFIPFLNFDL